MRALVLESFDTESEPDPSEATRPTPQKTAGEDALAAFDEGYRDGWEDCARAEAEAQRRITADLATNLAELSRGYEEARADVLANLGPLFEEMASQLLPTLAAEAVAPAVLSELTAIAETASAARAVLIASPAALPALERLLETQEDLEVELRAEPAYAEGQVSLRFGGERRDIDLSDAARRMAEALRAFVHQEAGPASLGSMQKGVA